MFRHLMCRKPLFLLSLLVVSSIGMFAQTTAAIVGNVTDASGSLIPNCAVQIKNELTGQVRETTSGPDGTYLMPLLPPGSYSVRATAAGFKSELRTQIAVSVQDNVR